MTIAPAFEDLAAKQAITEVLHRYCRAMDRMDRELALACWHAGGTDDHAPSYVGSAEGFLAWLWPVHASFLATRHTTSNILIALDGDKAGVESYCEITLRFRRSGDTFDLVTAGRYLDLFERVGGVWALRHRQSLSEWHRVDKVATTIADFADPPLVAASPTASVARATRAARDRSDPSYQLLP